jgi:serine/threonine protein kinase, bacterial
MASTGMLLQARYRIDRQLGGGGMGTVYLAEDTRLTGHYWAIKEMSPAQLPAQDRNWAITAFRQEAHMLANLSHPGLIHVTDYFPEFGNWYLVMDFVQGQTLENWLQQMPRGLPINAAVSYVTQLINVLEYLHTQNPPVIFRDLKPANVMVTTNGEIKLIDFGIARFFKPGQTHNTVNLGTPGYASPEHGSKGQTDARSDIYSLGVLLHQLTTGYDPVSAANPFQLPAARSLNPNVPATAEAAIQRATQLSPAQRFQTVVEFRQALLMPQAGPGGTVVVPPPAANAPGSTVVVPPPAAVTLSGSRSNPWMWIALSLVAVAAITIIAVASARSPATAPAAVPIAPSGGSTISPGGGSTPVVPSTPIPVMLPPGISPAPLTPVPSAPPASEPPGPQPMVEDAPLGQSVEGRAIRMVSVGYPDGPAVVMVGSIEGDQSDTSYTVEQLADHYRTQPDQVPNRGMLYLIPSLNPDGNARSQRLNSNNVDLNRNWEAANWKRNATCPGCGSGAGGSSPFSEPETKALRDLINSLSSRGATVYVVVLHSTVNDKQRDQVFPGYTASGMHGPSEDLTRRVGSLLGYGYNTQWSYDTNGELIGWCAEQGISSVDIVSKKGSGPSLSRMIDVVAEILR